MFAPALLPGVGLWCGQSPFAAVPRRKVPKRLPEHLRWHAVLELLDELGAPWRQVVAVAVYTALRKGAIFGLERQGMDLAKRKRRPCHSLPAGRPLAPAFSSGTRPRARLEGGVFAFAAARRPRVVSGESGSPAEAHTPCVL